MSNLEWKSDPSPLQMLVDGESAYVDEWKLHVDRIKESEIFSILDGLVGNMTDKERDVFDLRIKNDEERERRQRIRDSEKTHPYQWRVERDSDGTPQAFSFMGGRATTMEEAKLFAERALEFAKMTYAHFE